MSDPKDELGARFGDRKPGEKKPKDDTDKPHNTDNTDNMQTTSDTSDAGSKPGPDRDEDATRHRRQVPMYLSDERAEELNNLYEQLDARSKIAGNGGIEKHRDFMAELVDFAIEHEDDLAERLKIEE
jgi:hypothetical protein